MSIDFKKIKRAYCIGIKGVGMTALVQVLQSRGITVSGSDTNEKFFTDEVLKKLRIPVFEKFNKHNVPRRADLVVVSAAYLPKFKIQNKKPKITPNQKLRFGTGQANKKSKLLNPEVREVLKRKIPILTYPETLGVLSREYRTIAVAGTHGKSTTTAMLGVILEKAGFDPTVIVGTRVNQWGSNARVSRHEHDVKCPRTIPRSQSREVRGRQKSNVKCSPLVVEADEYREAFLHYQPYGLIITSVEYDHPDYFKTFGAYKNAFRKLVRRVPPDGFIVANWDDKNVRDAVRKAKCKIIRYGSEDARKIRLAIPGEFNNLNAGAAAAAAKEFGVREAVIKKALAGFRGTARRFEILSPFIVDDYAHHPTEIRVTLHAAREKWPKKELWVVFQPHTYSRTETLLDDFAKSFEDADRVFILETYGSAREDRGAVGARELADEISKYHQHVQYFDSIPHGVKMLKKKMKKNTRPVLITMGAGDVWEVGEKLVNY